MQNLNHNWRTMPDMNPLMKRYLVFGWEAHEQRGGFHDFLRDFSSRDEAYLYAKATKESHKIDEYQIYDTYSGQVITLEIYPLKRKMNNES